MKIEAGAALVAFFLAVLFAKFSAVTAVFYILDGDARGWYYLVASLLDLIILDGLKEVTRILEGAV